MLIISKVLEEKVTEIKVIIQLETHEKSIIAPEFFFFIFQRYGYFMNLIILFSFRNFFSIKTFIAVTTLSSRTICNYTIYQPHFLHETPQDLYQSKLFLCTKSESHGGTYRVKVSKVRNMKIDFNT